MCAKVLTPEEVFTPRSPEINPNSYIDRKDLEMGLAEAFRETQHVIIFGESGNGKSWLYKRVLAKENISYEVINLVQASRLGTDLNNAFKDKIDRLENTRKQLLELKKQGKLMPGHVGIAGESIWKYELGKKEPFEDLLAYMYSKAKRSNRVLILDNFEQISGSAELCKQLADCIILLDDPIYAQYGVKLCIVGVPSGIDQVLSKHGHVQTISSRIREISEVERMTVSESIRLLKRGLENSLRIRVDVPEKEFYNQVLWTTDRIALELQEFGLRLAQEATRYDVRKIDDRVFRRALEKWVKGSLKSDCMAVSTRFNSRTTKTSRRNQVIFAYGICEESEFDYRRIEKIVRREFPDSTAGVKLNVSGELSKLSKDDSPLLRKTAAGDTYRLVSPKYRMAIRAVLEKNSSGGVTRRIQKI